MNYTELLEIAKEINIKNPSMLLSGGLALKQQDLKIRREPEDIDIYLPFGSGPFIRLEGMVSVAVEEWEAYESRGFSLVRYKYRGIYVDVFQPEEWAEWKPATVKSIYFNCLSSIDVIAFKMNHALGEERKQSHWKHRDDLIYILLMN